jgi:hypothetical protein
LDLPGVGRLHLGIEGRGRKKTSKCDEERKFGSNVRRTVVQPLTRPEDVGREGKKRAKRTVVIDKNQTKENTCGDKVSTI